MSAEIEFVDGLFVYAPREGSPDFVMGAAVIKPAELIAWLQKRCSDDVRLAFKISKSGKAYASVDTYKPKERGERAAPTASDAPDDDIPF